MKTPVLIFESIPAGTVRQLIEREIKRPAKMDKVLIRFFPGQQNTLTVRPYIRKTSGAVQELSMYTGETSFAGDDNDVPFAVDVAIDQYDKVCIEVSNSSTYDYDAYVLFEIEYKGAVG